MPRSRSAPSPARSASSAAARPKPASSASPPPSSSTSSSYKAAPAAPQQLAAPPPMQQAPAPPPAVASSGGGGGIFSGLIGSVVTGAAMGTGSAIAHRAVDSFMGPREMKVVHENQPAEPAAAPAYQAAPSAGPCADRIKNFTDCMQRTNGDMGACDMYFQAMQQCKTSAGFTA